MKTDVLALAAIVFVIGLLFSSVASSDLFESAEQDQPPADLQQGIALH